MAESPTPPSQIPDGSIAIVGMACHFPGARDVEAFWQNLRQGVDSIRHFSEGELLAAGVDPQLVRHPRYVRANGVLDEMEWFDAGFFGLSARDAAVMDPQTRHFLECAWHALEHAGHVPDSFDGTIAVFAGAGAGRYFWQNVVRDPALMRDVGYFLLRHTGNDKDFLATRASYQFNLTGPSVSVQTACSTSLVATHYACQSLLSWECDLALAGGVTIEQPHFTGYLYEEGEILSPDGRCRSFDQKANGTVFGSGAGVVVLRRLADAIKDGDTIHAVIRGSAVNNDGAGKVSYLAPSVDGQVKVVSEALLVADVEPDTIGLVEGHGTATPVGDPIEVAALTRAFREQSSRSGFCALGSVKSNVGHLDTAAGVASLIKAGLAVKHGEIPPCVNFEKANPLLELESTPFFVNAELRAWPRTERPRRAGVTSLGVGGTNAHVVLEEWPDPGLSGLSRPSQLLTLSARSATALEDSTRALVDFLESNPQASLADIAHTLRRGRKRFDHRRTVVCRTAEDAIEALASMGSRVTTERCDAEGREVAFLFAGGGAQYPNMGRELYEFEPVFQEALDLCLDHLVASEALDLRPLLFCEPSEEEAAALELQRPSRALPALFAVQYAQARLWMSWGVTPSAMIGHSMGEYTAACLAGVFNPQDGMTIVSLRGRLFESVERGGMLSVSLTEDALRERLGDELSIAALNAPAVSVTSGPVGAIDALASLLRSEGIDCQRIRIDVAAHSSMLDPILPAFGEFLRTVSLAPPTIPVISNLTGRVAGREMTQADYWVRHLRETVRFSDGVGQLMRAGGPVLLEVGPGRTLSTVARMHSRWSQDQPVLHSLPHPTEREDALAYQLRTLGALWVHGVDPDWRGFTGTEARRRIPLPRYPFQRERYFVEPPARESLESGAPGQSADSSRRMDLADWFYKRSWVPTLSSDPSAATSEPRVLVLADRGTLGDRLATRMADTGATVTRVRSGASFEGTAANGYSLRPAHPADWTALLTTLQAADALPDVVIHAWCLGADPDGADQVALQGRAFFAPLHLIQALEEVAPGRPTRFVAVTSGAVDASGDERLEPHRALLNGPVRVAPSEVTTLRARIIDVGSVPSEGTHESRLIERLREEVFSDSNEPIVALRGLERLTEGFVPVPVGPAPGGAGLREGGTYLITGGLGGIGLVVARELAQQTRVNLVLLARTPLPEGGGRKQPTGHQEQNDKVSRAIREIEELENMGATVLTLHGDVSDRVRMKQVVAEVLQRFGHLNGVCHAAGVLNDGPLLTRGASESMAILTPKVLGTLALDESLEGLDLDFFMLFSSVSAVIGAPGQVDYAAANAFLDAFAKERAERTGQRTVSVAWGAWRDIGMAAELAGETAYGANHGSDAEVATALADNLFDSAVAGKSGQRGFRTLFRSGRHWMMDEHQIRGGPWVLPGSGYVELIRAAAERVQPEGSFELRDLVFLRPFRIESEEARELEVRLIPNADGWSVAVRGRRPGTLEGWMDHATARVGAGAFAAHTFERLEDVEKRIGEPSLAKRPAHPVMNFGPRWANIVAEATNGSEALLVHSLADAFRRDVEDTVLHPALLDMATAGAQHLVPGIDIANDLLVPAGYGALYLHRPLGASVTSHVVLTAAEPDGALAAFDVTIYDDLGQPAVSVRDFSMVRVAGDLLGEHRADDTPAWLRDAISPTEGREILRRIFARPVGAHVLVATRPLVSLIAEGKTQRKRDDGTRHKTRARVLIPSIAHGLEDHEAVAEAAALGSMNEESARVVAFIAFRSGMHATVSELRRFMRGRLDKQFVPQNFVEMVTLPRNVDGSIAIDKLRDPFATVDDYVAPRTETETTIARIWAELLALDRVGIHDNFLDVGGHSLVGIRVLRRIQQETGVRLEANALTMQTLEQLAADVDRAGGVPAAR